MELCYIAIGKKCFEILDGADDEDASGSLHASSSLPANTGANDADSSDEDSSDDEDEEADDDDAGLATNGTAGPSQVAVGGDSESQDEGNGDSDDDWADFDSDTKLPDLSLREILFYDDKISTFKARHCRL